MLKILVIEDEDAIRDCLCKLLQRAGYAVECAVNVLEGIKRYHQDPTDIIITDLHMPEKDGIEVIVEIKRDFPDVKIIAMSGGSYGTTSMLNMAKLFGAQHIMKKPFGNQELLDAVAWLEDI